MASSKGSKGSIVGTIFGLILVAIAIVALVHFTGIKSFGDAWNYARGKSDQYQECLGEKDCGHLPDAISSDKPEETKSESTKEKYLKKLEKIPVSDAEKKDFEIKDWPHWSGDQCDTREKYLLAKGSNVKSNSSSCAVISGEWKNSYTGESLKDPRSIELDYIIPLDYANSHGGNGWDVKEKEKFANDSANLAITDKETKDKRESQSPSDWTPDSDQCSYASKWINVASKYKISITEKDKKELSKSLNSCK